MNPHGIWAASSNTGTSRQDNHDLSIDEFGLKLWSLFAMAYWPLCSGWCSASSAATVPSGLLLAACTFCYFGAMFHQDAYWLPVLFATSARSSSVCYRSSQLTLALHANAKRKVCLALAIEAYIARIDCPEYPAQRSRPSMPSSTISILGFVSLSLDASRHNSGSGANWMDK